MPNRLTELVVASRAVFSLAAPSLMPASIASRVVGSSVAASNARPGPIPILVKRSSAAFSLATGGVNCMMKFR